MQVKRPTLLVDEKKVRKNIDKMVCYANSQKVQLRPHFKTHQSSDIAEWYREAGVTKITVSSVSMAQYFQNDWNDITIAFPYNILESEEVDALAKRVRLNVLIESQTSLDHLQKHTSASLGYFLKIDVGTHRTGIDPNQLDLIQKLIESGNDNVHFKGLLAHAGHSYRARSKEEILKIHKMAKEDLLSVGERLGTKLFVSYGDTPSCSVSSSLEGIDEIRPGNFAFYDVMQANIGSCSLQDVAVAMACPVVAIHEGRQEAVVYGGGVHFSKDSIQNNSGSPFYGEVVHFSNDGWEHKGDAVLSRISQEHGIVKGTEEMISQLRIGDILGVLPIHSCMSADLMPGYFTFDGKPLNKAPKIL